MERSFNRSAFQQSQQDSTILRGFGMRNGENDGRGLSAGGEDISPPDDNRRYGQDRRLAE